MFTSITLSALEVEVTLLSAALSTRPGAEGRGFKLPLSHGLILQLQASRIPPFCPAVPTCGQGKCH